MSSAPDRGPGPGLAGIPAFLRPRPRQIRGNFRGWAGDFPGAIPRHECHTAGGRGNRHHFQAGIYNRLAFITIYVKYFLRFFVYFCLINKNFVFLGRDHRLSMFPDPGPERPGPCRRGSGNCEKIHFSLPWPRSRPRRLGHPPAPAPAPAVRTPPVGRC